MADSNDPPPAKTRYPTCVAGNLNADARPDLVAGNFWVGTPDPLDAVTVRINGALPVRPQQVTRR
jgi:hypothetical protein